MTRNLISRSFAGLVLALGCATLAVAEASKAPTAPTAPTVTLAGEVIDLHCYMLHPDTGKGADHAECANSCIDRGLPAGFLSDGKVYMLIGPGHDSPKGVVGGHAGHPVKLTGTLIEHDGMHAIQVASVVPADGQPAPAPATQRAKEHKEH